MFYISKNDWNKIINYARAREAECGDEIGGMAIARKDKEDDWIISHPTILKQETTGGTCTLDKDELSNYYIDMANKYGTDIQFVWWHSHAKMQAFWSGTDTSTMKEYASGDWSMFLVVNVREEYKFRVQYWNPMEIGEDIELNIMGKDKGYKIPKSITEEVTEKCSEVVRSTINNYKKNGYGHYIYDGNSRQTALWRLKENPKEELEELLDEVESYNDSIDNGYQLYISHDSIQETPVSFLAEQLEEGHSNYCDGSLKYDRYKKAVNEFNDTLEKLEGQGSPKLRVYLHPEGELLDACMTMNPLDFLTVNGKPILEVYHEREDVMDIDDVTRRINDK